MKGANGKIYPEERYSCETGNFEKLTFEEFVSLVADMRHQQRRYFALRRPEILSAAEELERRVDEEIARLTDKQLSLF